MPVIEASEVTSLHAYHDSDDRRSVIDYFHIFGADLGFYKGGCPIHLKGAPEVERRRSNIFPAFWPSNDPLIVHISAHVLI